MDTAYDVTAYEDSGKTRTELFTKPWLDPTCVERAIHSGEPVGQGRALSGCAASPPAWGSLAPVVSLCGFIRQELVLGVSVAFPQQAVTQGFTLPIMEL